MSPNCKCNRCLAESHGKVKMPLEDAVEFYLPGGAGRGASVLGPGLREAPDSQAWRKAPVLNPLTGGPRRGGWSSGNQGDVGGLEGQCG